MWSTTRTGIGAFLDRELPDPSCLSTASKIEIAPLGSALAAGVLHSSGGTEVDGEIISAVDARCVDDCVLIKISARHSLQGGGELFHGCVVARDGTHDDAVHADGILAIGTVRRVGFLQLRLHGR